MAIEQMVSPEVSKRWKMTYIFIFTEAVAFAVWWHAEKGKQWWSNNLIAENRRKNSIWFLDKVRFRCQGMDWVKGMNGVKVKGINGVKVKGKVTSSEVRSEIKRDIFSRVIKRNRLKSSLRKMTVFLNNQEHWLDDEQLFHHLWNRSVRDLSSSAQCMKGYVCE